ncbi:murein biosynthesis integral membrane protein MurJ [Treponema sp.]|uniref:murein biosynthesis integral membrane protein MurJ n=1 Tax=Treponema sp. TaxID=166 RepID=UPI00257CC61C|nr:murein biosynthesis integral membrane protein MurJ [Treponema sp.]MBE6354034.1 murein biosynthesis integral membrane protein MurJ [Treponema sp.]
MNNNDEKPTVQPEQKKSRSLLSKGLSLSVLTLLSRILGLIREMTKSKFLGTSSLSDAFTNAFMIPNLFRRLFAENSISVAFIPTFKGYLEENDGEEGKKTIQQFINSTFTLVSFCTVLFVTLGMIFTPVILRIFYKNPESLSEAAVLTRIMFPYLVVISIAAFFQGILNGLKIFSPSGFTPILFNSIVITATYVLAPVTKNPARAMAIGVITGGSIQCLFQLPFVLKTGWNIKLTSLKNAFTNPGTKKVLLLIGPTIIGMAGYQVNDLVSSALATRAGTGVVSSLQYSLRLQELILGICAVTIGTIILPDLAGFVKKQLWNDFNSMLTTAVKIMTLISIPITFYAVAMGDSLITLVYASGKFDENSIKQTTSVFNFHIAGLLFIALNRILGPAFYAQSDTKSPTIAGLVNFAVNILLAALLVGKYEGKGIAFALTAASFVNTVMLFIFFRKNKFIQAKKIILESLLYGAKTAVFSAAAVIPVILMKKKLLEIFAGHSRFISMGLPVGITAALFALCGVFLLVITRDSILKGALSKIRHR